MSIKVANLNDTSYGIVNESVPQGSYLIAYGTLNSSSFDVSGGGTMVMENATINTDFAEINANVVGVGTFNLGFWADGTPGFEVNQASGPGITYKVSDSGEPLGARLCINDPKQFQSLVVLEKAATTGGYDSAGISISNLSAAVTSYDYRNDMLQLYSGSKIIDTLRVQDPTNSKFYLTSQGPTGVYLTWMPQSSAIPIHSSHVS